MLALGPYRILRKLGAGGMGAVFEVERPGDPRRLAAKVLLRTDPRARERFRREGQLVARLEHPGIVAVRDAGETADGRPFLVFDLVAASSLAEVLRRGPMAEPEVVQLGVRLARALGHAHARGVVHRDVKPENILIDAEGAPRVMDFGIASAGDLERLTRTGEFTGTIRYMAPEQLSASSAVGPPADVHALGLVLHESITGRQPFDDADGPALMVAIVSRRPPDLRALDRRVSPGLSALVARCLEKEPASRPEHGDALADALERLPLAGRTDSSRRRLLAGAALLSVSAATAVMVGGPTDATGPGPASAAPAGSSAGSAAPRTSRVAAADRELAIGLVPGEELACELVYERRGVRVATPWWVRITIDMRWTVEDASIDVLPTTWTLEKVRITGASEEVSSRGAPGLAAGASIDRRTGRVAMITGMHRLRSTLLEEFRDHSQVLLNYLGGIDDTMMARVLGLLLQQLPDRGLRADESRWDVDLDGSLRRFESDGLLSGDATVRSSLTAPAGERRRLDTVATWRGGRLVASEVIAEVTTPLGDHEEQASWRLLRVGSDADGR